MAEKNIKPLEGFDMLANFLVGPKDGILKPDGDEKVQYQDIDPDDLQKKMSGDDEPPLKDDKKPNEPEPKKEDKPIEPIKKDDKVDINNKSNKPVDNKTDDNKADDNKTDEDNEYETEISSFFAGQLVKELGIDEDFKDVKFENTGEVIELMKEIINENSTPNYASEEVEKYDEFVRNGGDLKNFYKELYSNKLDLEAIDLEKDYDQRAIIRENLINQGYKEDKIKKIITRYEEAETLKEEGEDALELLKEHNIQNQQSLLEKQKKLGEEALKTQPKF